MSTCTYVTCDEIANRKIVYKFGNNKQYYHICKNHYKIDTEKIKLERQEYSKYGFLKSDLTIK